MPPRANRNVGLSSDSPYKQHVEKWRNCEECELCKQRTNVVVRTRGSVPADILFIGEAPGDSEDVLGKPFVGPAGALLDLIIERCLPENVSWCMTNLVACIPLDEDGNKTKEPPKESILACRSRLLEFVNIVKPKLIVCVGKLAEAYSPTVTEMIGKTKFKKVLSKQCSITHPAAIIRMDDAQQGLAIQRCMIVLRDAISEITQ